MPNRIRRHPRVRVVRVKLPARNQNAKHRHLTVPLYELAEDPPATRQVTPPLEAMILRPPPGRGRAIRVAIRHLAAIHETRRRTSLSQDQTRPNATGPLSRQWAVTLIRIKPTVQLGPRLSFGVPLNLDLETRATLRGRRCCADPRTLSRTKEVLRRAAQQDHLALANRRGNQKTTWCAWNPLWSTCLFS